MDILKAEGSASTKLVDVLILLFLEVVAIK